MASEQKASPHKIVIVGGGAGGLELATRLGDTLGRRRKALITLVDRSRTHLWKPLLHQVAAGSMDLNDHELDYLYQARWHHFQFQLGRMDGLDRAAQGNSPRADARRDRRAKSFRAAHPVRHAGHCGRQHAPTTSARRARREYAISLDNPQQAALFHSRLLNACLRANAQAGRCEPGQLHIAIIGAGATGVELAAELHNTIRELVSFGLDRINPERDIKITIVEAAPQNPARAARAIVQQQCWSYCASSTSRY